MIRHMAKMAKMHNTNANAISNANAKSNANANTNTNASTAL